MTILGGITMKKIVTKAMTKEAQERKTVAEVVAFYLPDIQEMTQVPYTKQDAIDMFEEVLGRLEWLPE